MKQTNLSITLYLARRWLADNALGIFLLLAAGGAMAVTVFDPDATATEEFATVAYSYNTPDKYAAIDMMLIATLSDGRTICLALPTGWVPPLAGKQIRVKRIRRLFFGERFVLLRQP